MEQELIPEEVDPRELEVLREFINTMDGLNDKERGQLKNNIQYPGIRRRVSEIKNMLERRSPEARHGAGILLESLKSDIKDF